MGNLLQTAHARSWAFNRVSNLALVVLLLVFTSSAWSPATAQHDGDNWYFGANAGITFNTPNRTPRALTNGMLSSYETCATISESSTGRLLFYSDGLTVWNRNHLPLPNGSGLKSHPSASQGVVFVQNPADTSSFYLFTVDAQENSLANGLRYSVIDRRLQGGLGDIGVVKNVAALANVRMVEKLAVVKHSNGLDYWILTHGWNSSTFYAFQLTRAGLLAPVTTSIGPVHSGGGGSFGMGNAGGQMKASADGRKVAICIRDLETDLVDFDPATGLFSNLASIASYPYNYGLEFSPDGSKLYISTLSYGGIYQLNLAAGSITAIRNSALTINTTDNFYKGSIQIGPDGKVYIAQDRNSYLAKIEQPDALGLACGYTAQGVYLGGRFSQVGLPYIPSRPFQFQLLPVTQCVGQPVALELEITGASTSAISVSWDFGDPSSGSLNYGTGVSVSHTYRAASNYQVTATITYQGLIRVLSATVTIINTPTVDLGPDRSICVGEKITLRAQERSNATYLWQDGSTSSSLEVSQAGTYHVSLSLGGLCYASDTVVVSTKADSVFIPNVITPNGDGSNDYFVVSLPCKNTELLTIDIYNRWGTSIYHRSKYDNTWNGSSLSAGLFYYCIRDSDNHLLYKGWVEIIR